MDERYEQIDNASLETRLENLNTQQIGKITKINKAGDRATVQLLNKRNFNGRVEDQAELLDVPVFMLSVPGFLITTPLSDYLPAPCIVLFMQRSIDNIIDAENVDSVHPDDNRMHSLSDAICIPGITSIRAKSINASNLELRSFDGKSKIEMSEDGKFKITNGKEDLLKIVYDLLETLSVTKAQVGYGSSAGMHDLNTNPLFDQLKMRLDELIL